MGIGPKSTSRQYYFYINNDAHPISTVQEEKDLGVTFDENLHFKTQIIHKANNVLGTSKRNFSSRDPVVIRLLYTTLVRPIVDYASTIWNPQHLEHICELENIQRRATKLISILQNLPYSDRLQSLNLPSLSYRRNRMDLIMTYKILNGAVLVDKEYCFYNEHQLQY